MDSYSVDVTEEYQKAKKTFLIASLIFSSLFTIVLVIDILLVALANEEYQANLIISIVITSLFAWFAIYFFTNIYQDINNRYRYFKGYQSGEQSTDEVIVIDTRDDLTYVNGLYVYPLFVKYVSNLEGTEKIIYSSNKDLGLTKGDKLTVTTYRRILVKMEKHS